MAASMTLDVFLSGCLKDRFVFFYVYLNTMPAVKELLVAVIIPSFHG